MQSKLYSGYWVEDSIYRREKMELDTAIAILRERVEADRFIRGFDNIITDYDRWAEEQCIAIERVLEEIENGRTS